MGPRPRVVACACVPIVMSGCRVVGCRMGRTRDRGPWCSYDLGVAWQLVGRGGRIIFAAAAADPAARGQEHAEDHPAEQGGASHLCQLYDGGWHSGFFLRLDTKPGSSPCMYVHTCSSLSLCTGWVLLGILLSSSSLSTLPRDGPWRSHPGATLAEAPPFMPFLILYYSF